MNWSHYQRERPSRWEPSKRSSSTTTCNPFLQSYWVTKSSNSSQVNGKQRSIWGPVRSPQHQQFHVCNQLVSVCLCVCGFNSRRGRDRDGEVGKERGRAAEEAIKWPAVGAQLKATRNRWPGLVTIKPRFCAHNWPMTPSSRQDSYYFSLLGLLADYFKLEGCWTAGSTMPEHQHWVCLFVMVSSRT